MDKLSGTYKMECTQQRFASVCFNRYSFLKPINVILLSWRSKNYTKNILEASNPCPLTYWRLLSFQILKVRFISCWFPSSCSVFKRLCTGESKLNMALARYKEFDTRLLQTTYRKTFNWLFYSIYKNCKHTSVLYHKAKKKQLHPIWHS
jgi:hypothetical protein